LQERIGIRMLRRSRVQLLACSTPPIRGARHGALLQVQLCGNSSTACRDGAKLGIDFTVQFCLRIATMQAEYADHSHLMLLLPEASHERVMRFPALGFSKQLFAAAA